MGLIFHVCGGLPGRAVELRGEIWGSLSAVYVAELIKRMLPATSEEN